MGDRLVTGEGQAVRTLNEGSGSVGQEEVAVAEAPEHTDAGQAGIAGCEDVDIAVAHIDGIVTRDAELPEGFYDGVGGRLLADALRLMLADGHLDGVREEMGTERLRGLIKLVAHHR